MVTWNQIANSIRKIAEEVLEESKEKDTLIKKHGGRS